MKANQGASGIKAYANLERIQIVQRSIDSQ